MFDYVFSIVLFLLVTGKAIQPTTFTGTVQADRYSTACVKAWQAIDVECKRITQETGAKIASAEFRVDRVDPPPATEYFAVAIVTMEDSILHSDDHPRCNDHSCPCWQETADYSLR